MIKFLLWCLLFVACWPVAIAALLLYPLVWILLLPFRLLGIAVHGVLAFVSAMVMLPPEFFAQFSSICRENFRLAREHSVRWD